ncbi:hypothetical protein AJ87_11105 [Rhizobium yanglingense]|nr:hypothetical protein AJ87_11105 [Rhizobium yanglingense]
MLNRPSEEWIVCRRLDRAFRAGAVQQTFAKAGNAKQLLDIFVRKVHPRCPKYRFPDPEAFADEMAKRDAAGCQIASMILGWKFGLETRDLWLAFGYCLQNLNFDQRDFANVGFRRLGSSAEIVSVANNSTLNELRF